VDDAQNVRVDSRHSSR